MTGDTRAGDGPTADDDAHVAALLAVLALAQADADPSDDLPATPLQQWRYRRLAALSAEGASSDRPRVVPRHRGQRTSF
jgi:hypothetical protein